MSKGISYIGSRLFSFGLSWYVLDLTGSSIQFGITLLLNYIPTILVSLLAGYLNDRIYKPRHILILCDVCSATISCLAFFHRDIWVLYLCVLFLSCFAALFNNTFDSWLPNLHGVSSKNDLKIIMSYWQQIAAVVNLLAPALGGILCTVFDIRIFALLNSVSFLVSALVEAKMNWRVKQTPQRLYQRSKNSYNMLMNNNYFRILLFRDSLSNFFVSAGVSISLPIIAKNIFDASSLHYGLIVCSLSVGSYFGAYAYKQADVTNDYRYPVEKVYIIAISMIALALLAYVATAYTLKIIFACIIQFLNGWMMASINLSTVSAVHFLTNENNRGKAFGLMTGFSYALIPISVFISSVTLENIAIWWTPLFCGVMLAFSTKMISLYEEHTARAQNIT